MVNWLSSLPHINPLICVHHFNYVCPLFSCAGDKDHPKYVEPPVIPGHEFIGEVVKLGKGEQ